MDVTGAGRGIEDEIVEVSPVGIGNELLEGIGGHSASPEGGGIGIDEEADGEHLHAVFLDGGNEIAAIDMDGIGTGIFDLQHLGNGGSEDIGIEEAYLITETGQGDGEIHGDGALADSTLSAAHGDDVFHARQHLPHFGTGL